MGKYKLNRTVIGTSGVIPLESITSSLLLLFSFFFLFLFLFKQMHQERRVRILSLPRDLLSVQKVMVLVWTVFVTS